MGIIMVIKGSENASAGITKAPDSKAKKAEEFSFLVVSRKDEKMGFGSSKVDDEKFIASKPSLASFLRQTRRPLAANGWLGCRGWSIAC